MHPFEYLVMVCETDKDDVEQFFMLFDYPEIIMCEDEKQAQAEAAYDCAADLALAEKQAEDSGMLFSYKIFVRKF